MKIEDKQEWSNKENKPANWQWTLSGLFFIISYPLMMFGILILNISNILMFDTHHMDVKITPKK